MSYEEILVRFKEVNVLDTFGTKKEIKELVNVIQQNEKIMYATSGFADGNTWLIVVTNLRVILLDKGMIYGLKQVDIPINKINSTTFKKGLILGEIVIYHGATEFKISQIDKKTLSPLVDAINKEVEILKNSNSTSNQISTDLDIPSKILKFKELLDMGIITEEEFEIQKNKLLNS